MTHWESAVNGMASVQYRFLWTLLALLFHTLGSLSTGTTFWESVALGKALSWKT